MGIFKAYMLGVASAYGVYLITRKNLNGRSILDDLIERPDVFIKKAKDELLQDTAVVVKQAIR